MKIVLPWPDAGLNPNRYKGAHWAAVAKLRKAAREAAYWVARAALVQNAKEQGVPMFVGGQLRLQITFLTPNRQARDLDNLLAALKPSLDGIADCLGTDDSKFEPITISRGYGGKPGSVVVEVFQ